MPHTDRCGIGRIGICRDSMAVCPRIRIGRWSRSTELTCFGWPSWPPTREADLFRRNPQGSGRYAGRLLCRALCQGAALHYVNKTNGVKDFDVWSFYAQYDDWSFPARWRGTRDCGPSKFGRYPGDPPRYAGRRVDLLGRSLPAGPGADPAEILRRYLAARRTDSAKALAAKAVVLIHPPNRAGEIAWPVSQVS
jgi:hypothetical protein